MEPQQIHPNAKNLTNKKFNYLTAIHPVKKPETVRSRQLGTWWLCRCDCGNEKIVRSRELIANETKSCGCKNKFTQSSKYKGIGIISQTFFSRLVRGAASRQLVVDITKEYLWELYNKQKGACYFTGLPIGIPSAAGEKTASVDRLDSTKGYIEGNVVWVHKDINLMKNVFTVDKFVWLCKLITDNKNLQPKLDIKNINNQLED
jgi:hypothetical protein